VAPRKSYDAVRHLPPEQRQFGDHIVGIHRIFPNAIVVWQRDHVEFWTEVRPADRDKWEKNWQILRGTVQAEDFPMARTIQQGFHSGAQDHVVFGRNE